MSIPLEQSERWPKEEGRREPPLPVLTPFNAIKPGDSMVGHDDELYLIDEVEELNHGLLLHAIDRDGRPHRTYVPLNGYGKVVQGHRDYLDPESREYGLKRCQDCGERRSIRMWSYDVTFVKCVVTW